VQATTAVAISGMHSITFIPIGVGFPLVVFHWLIGLPLATIGLPLPAHVCVSVAGF